MTHIPRLEDWPVMPVERIGFMLMVFHSPLAYDFATIFLCKFQMRCIVKHHPNMQYLSAHANLKLKLVLKCDKACCIGKSGTSVWEGYSVLSSMSME